MNNSIVSRVVAASSLLGIGAGCSSFEETPKGDGDLVAKTQSALIDTAYALDTNPDLANPERGVSYWAGSSGSDPHTVKNHFLYLGNSCATNLTWQGRTHANTSQVLKDWANTAVGIRDTGKKVIFRPRYDTSSAGGQPNACGLVEGDSYARMQNHAQAVGAMLADLEIRPIVAFVEMGYLGSWGEWNTGGTNCGTSLSACRPFAPVLLAPSAVNDRIHFAAYVIDTYRNAGMTRPVGLRRPEFFKDTAWIGVASTKMGFYNDCFMQSSSDGGTFSHLESGYPGYAEIYPDAQPVLSNSAAYKSYMQSMAVESSNGGESCNPNGSELWRANPGPSGVAQRFDDDSYHYFHPGNDPSPPAPFTDFRQTMVNAGVWNDIKSRFGYRYHATQVDYPASATTGASVTVSVSINNSGFAKISYDRTAYIALHGPTNYVVGTTNPKSGTYTLITPTAQSNQSVRSWNEDTTTVFSQTFPAPSVSGTYTLRLYVPDTDCVNNASCSDATKSSYAVRLATTRGGSNVFDPGTGTNNLGVTLAVSSAPTFSLNVRTYNQANSAEITGLWTVVNDSQGAQLTGFSPITFNVPSGTTNVSVADFQQYLFNHWENGTTVRPRQLSVTGNVNVGGYYAVGGGCVTPSANNRVTNAGFDSSNVSSFQPFDPQIQVSHATLDSMGCGSSGSLLLTNTAPNGLNSGAYQCVTTITPGATYNVGGKMRVPSGGAQGQTFLHFIFTNGANCTGAFVGEQVLLSGPSTFDTWQSVRHDNLVAPANAVSMQVYGSVIKNFPNALSYRAYYDMLYVTPAPGEF